MVIRKRFGQHFLEPAWVHKVLSAVDPKPTETFLEIGPGRGALTRPLVDRTGGTVAFEIDPALASELVASALPGLTVVEGDFLESRWLETHPLAGPVRVVGNLPYNVSLPILFRLVELYAGGIGLVDATLMLQREVADRLVAEPGNAPVWSGVHPHPALRGRRTVAGPAAGGFPPGPEGVVRAGAGPISRTRSAGEKPGDVRRSGASDLHATPENPRECPPGIAGCHARGAHRRAGADRYRRPAAARNGEHRRAGSAGRRACFSFPTSCVTLTRAQAGPMRPAKPSCPLLSQVHPAA